MEYELKHWGVKGQKWGVRRYQNKDGSLTPAGKKRRKSDNYHEDYKKAHDNKPISQMSTKELQDRNNRLQQEQNYKRLTQKKSKGEAVLKAFIATATTIVAIENAAKVYKRVGSNALDKLGGVAMDQLLRHNG